MSLELELEFLYSSGMSEDDLIAQAIADSMRTAEIDIAQTSARQNIEKQEEETILSEKEATRVLRARQDIEYAESLREDQAKESLKFGKMLEESILSVCENEYDFDWEDDGPIENSKEGCTENPPLSLESQTLEKPSSREQLREARLKFFTK